MSDPLAAVPPPPPSLAPSDSGSAACLALLAFVPSMACAALAACRPTKRSKSSDSTAGGPRIAGVAKLAAAASACAAQHRAAAEVVAAGTSDVALALVAGSNLALDAAAQHAGATPAGDLDDTLALALRVMQACAALRGERARCAVVGAAAFVMHACASKPAGKAAAATAPAAERGLATMKAALAAAPSVCGNDAALSLELLEKVVRAAVARVGADGLIALQEWLASQLQQACTACSGGAPTHGLAATLRVVHLIQTRLLLVAGTNGRTLSAAQTRALSERVLLVATMAIAAVQRCARGAAVDGAAHEAVLAAVTGTVEWLCIAASRPRTIRLRSHDVAHLLHATVPIVDAARRSSGRLTGDGKASGADAATVDVQPEYELVAPDGPTLCLQALQREEDVSGGDGGSPSVGHRQLTPELLSASCKLLHTLMVHHSRSVQQVVPSVVQLLQSLLVLFCQPETGTGAWVSVDSARKLVRVFEQIVKVRCAGFPCHLPVTTHSLAAMLRSMALRSSTTSASYSHSMCAACAECLLRRACARCVAAACCVCVCVCAVMAWSHHGCVCRSFDVPCTCCWTWLDHTSSSSCTVRWAPLQVLA